MTTILGIDPGATSGWCIYDATARTVVASGQFDGFAFPHGGLLGADLCAQERPKGYGPTRPQLVDCGYVAGRLAQQCEGLWLDRYRELTRLEVCRALSDAVHGVIRVRNDATAWAALLELHGGADAAKKGGPLHGVKAHGRAALAVAVACSLVGGKPCLP